MLVLTRKENESVTLTLKDGSEVNITLAKINGNQARVGIHADKIIQIERSELINRGKKIDNSC